MINDFFRKGILYCLLLSSLNTTLHAEINDYFIRRLVLYESDCELATIMRKDIVKDEEKFYVTCKNVSFYPDGVDIHCSSDTDETSCVIKTESRKFNSLDILHRDRTR